MVPINHHHDPLPPTLLPPPPADGRGKAELRPCHHWAAQDRGWPNSPQHLRGGHLHPWASPPDHFPPQHSIAPRPPFGGESVGGGGGDMQSSGLQPGPVPGGGVALIPNSPGRPSALRCPPPLICGAAAEGALILLLRTMPNSATAAPGTDVTPRAAAPSLCPRFVPPVFPPLLGGRRGSEAAALRRAAGRGRCRTANGARRAHSDEGRG